MRHVVVIACIVALFFWWQRPSPLLELNGSEAYAYDEPMQYDSDDDDSFGFKGFVVTPLAEFEINAKVLGRKNYSRGRESEVSPVDLALGWGEMANPEVLQHVDISQSGRWYRWQVDQLPIPRRRIETQSANMHIIPADELVEDELDDVDLGDVVRLTGHLVRVEAGDGWRWASSLTRNDTGAGACEVVFVEQIDILNL